MSDVFGSMFSFGKYSSEEYIFKETLHNHILKTNPGWNSYKLTNISSNKYLFSRVDLVRVEEIDRLKSYYNLQLERIERRLLNKFEKFKTQIAERDGEDSELFN
ncbi:MAG: hypothetical protein IIC74_04305, partial [Bacteroidetes bacterium]|nr:hypothetical protein [Bacteroidota bacterium]